MNPSLFQSAARKPPIADTMNEAGGIAYALPPKAALAQYAVTGCLNGTFYASAETQLQTVLDLCGKVNDPMFVAKLAVYAREHGHMKDMPALLAAWLCAKDSALLGRVFDRVIDNGKMLSNFVKVVRSGVTGRKSLGTAPKRYIARWFDKRPSETIWRQSVGVTEPSIADILRMVHPTPLDEAHKAMFGYLSGRNSTEHAIKTEWLPPVVGQLEAFKVDPSGKTAPDAPWLILSALPLTPEHWKGIARTASWQTTRMNLNTFARHGVFADSELVKLCADRLRNPDLIAKARVFPYQLLAAYMNIGAEVPRPLVEAIHDAMEVAVMNVPKLEGKAYVCVDVSGSMRSPVTGERPGATTKVQCIHVAALMAASILRRNPDSEVVVFSDRVHQSARLELRDTVLTNAQRLSSEPSGGTNCSAPIAFLNHYRKHGDTIVMISDYESWCDSRGWQVRGTGDPTGMMREWMVFRAANKGAKLVCVDLQPNATVQVQSRPDVLNVGGFSDRVFDVMADFVASDSTADHWTKRIEEVTV